MEQLSRTISNMDSRIDQKTSAAEARIKNSVDKQIDYVSSDVKSAKRDVSKTQSNLSDFQQKMAHQLPVYPTRVATAGDVQALSSKLQHTITVNHLKQAEQDQGGGRLV